MHPDEPFAALNLSFSDIEPQEGQRWTTWPASTPSERGPEPRPPWVITSSGAIDTELGVVKSGKESDLFLIERAVPGGPASLMAAKRYRSAERSDFHRSSAYTEGRRTRRSRDQRAMDKGTAYGRQVRSGQWAGAEFAALCLLYRLGAPVPYPVQISGTEVLMEYLGDRSGAAPRLAALRPDSDELADLWRQLVEAMGVLARAQLAHGDLSPYNLLVHEGRLVMIDLPQVVDLVVNPQGQDLLQRDCRNVCDWFRRRGLDTDPDWLFGELIAQAW